ncbi:hypothetical protein [Zobellella endophytica]|uniref:hypothetical protein n=1 Tax=Zobellella endophytica TaxID=2116700 RepID=UPI0011B20482|nr:hypothetical protein [Zobellella endophytica]
MSLSRVEKIEWLVSNLEEISKSYFISKAINQHIISLDFGFEAFAPYRHLCNVLVADVVIRWCKVFGTDNEEMHWKKLINEADLVAFRADLFSSANVSQEEYSAYWRQMKEVRDSVCAHFNYEYVGKEIPHFEKAIDSASAAHSYFVNVLIKLGVKRSKFDLKQFGLLSSEGFIKKIR